MFRTTRIEKEYVDNNGTIYYFLCLNENEYYLFKKEKEIKYVLEKNGWKSSLQSSFFDRKLFKSEKEIIKWLKIELNINNTIDIKTIKCNGYQNMIKLDYIEINDISELEDILEYILNKYDTLIFGGKCLYKENLKALYYRFLGEFLSNNELIICITHYEKYITLNTCDSIENFEEIIFNIDNFKEENIGDENDD